jgi:LmbE family N-acetylglucosaminyl deacetylase
MRIYFVFYWILFFIALQGQAQTTVKNSSELYQDLLKLGTVGSVLYVAAHPDDENTRMIALLANKYHLETTYLSLTRGDGGQNLIGNELGELLGVLRTQELLQARKTDGGKQFFTRANDFGFSKTADETLDVWDVDSIQHDFIWAVRNTRPDIIINRFDHKSNGRTHGHHTSSGILSYDLFEKAADSTCFPEQLVHVSTWQPQSLFFNTSWWFYGSQEAFDKANKEDMYAMDIGAYYPHLGISNNEIAAKSRSMHRCQGFGSALNRGSEKDYLLFLKGNKPHHTHWIDSYDFTWNRIKEGKEIHEAIEKLKSNFDFIAPHKNIESLIKIKSLIAKIEDEFWRRKKSEEVDELILACAGFFIECHTNIPYSTPGNGFQLQIETINRSPVPSQIKTITLTPDFEALVKSDTVISLEQNIRWVQNFDIQVYPNKSYSQPYWLREKGTTGMYTVQNPTLIGQPEDHPAYAVTFALTLGGQDLYIQREVFHKYVDPAKGEVVQPFWILPKVTLAIEKSVNIITHSETKNIQVALTSQESGLEGFVFLEANEGWEIYPDSIPFTTSAVNQLLPFTFQVSTKLEEAESPLKAYAKIKGESFDLKLVTIDYDHIPHQKVLLPNTSHLKKIPLRKGKVKNIGYIMGSGDEVPSVLEEVGYSVDLISLHSTQLKETLQLYPVVILGIRALNTLDEIQHTYETLMQYVKDGGTLIQQYNVSRPLKVKNPGPFPITIGRDRVTDEKAPILILEPNHPIFNYPNTITESDFSNWVQERGLYFALDWHDSYLPLTSTQDANEKPKQGGLLVAEHGEGHFIFTSYSWFRQLPAGVPGAIKLFSNLISISESQPWK